MTRETAIEMLLHHPLVLARQLGFDRLTPLHERWMRDMITGKGDKTLQAHRGSYKTTCVALSLAILMVLLPNRRILFLRKTDADTKEVLAQVRKILETEPMRDAVRSLYGVELRLTTATANELNTNLTTDLKGTAQLTGLGLGSSITGKHFDRIFTDDIVNVSDRISRAERERTKLMYQELHNIVNRGGRIFNTGTPWHEDDAFSVMPPAVQYDCYSTGLISDEELETIRSGMTAALFAANYELRHIAGDGLLFSAPVTGADPSLAEQGFAHVDAAYSGKDHTALSICCRRDGEYYVYGRLWREHVDDVLDQIVALRRRFAAGTILCEDNADKGYLARDLRRRGERVAVYHESMNKYLKIATYLKTAWPHVHFVDGTDREYIAMICDYTEESERDDAPDSLASLIRRLCRRDAPQREVLPRSREWRGGWNG